MRNFLLTSVLILLATSCNYFTKEIKTEAIARVGDEYLFVEDIINLVPAGSSKADSIQIVESFINRWASQKLMIAKAELNLRDSDKMEFDNLVEQYKVDLYTKAYIEELVKQTIDTSVSVEELKEYYTSNKDNFRTSEALLKLRYIHLQNDNPKYEIIKQKFFDYNKKDRQFWETYKLQFKDFALNDSVWVEMNQVYKKLPFVTPENRDTYIAAGKSIQYRDSLDMYLVKIVNVTNKNQVSPFEYLQPTLKQVIVNKRKVELIKKIEKEITDDAIKDKEYEVYK
ncbi:hypothetical protein [Flavobacterium ardleyense]|uniref:hypothetical protein n=1 Tax=Flavobacterium ardleyense TaxID=2038737 RepID=UPI00298C8F87|nr:hypothetical protein [Flavobacterium ardleyense]